MTTTTPADGTTAVWPPVEGRPKGAPRPVGASPSDVGGATDHRRSIAALRTTPRRASVAVALVLSLVTVALTALSWQVNARSEQRLLGRQLAQVGTLLTNQAAVLRTEMADIGQVAVNTNANPNAFARFAAGELKQTGQSLTLWRITDGHAQQLAAQGVDARLPPDGPSALTRLRPTGQLEMLGILPGRPDRLSYALMPSAPNTDLVIYAESPLPSDHRLEVTATSPLAGLDLALYLGKRPDPAKLLETTAPLPIRGRTQTLSVPFGADSITIVGNSPTRLTGALSAVLPWIVLGVGTALAIAGAATLEFVSRRRALAERLAAENAELYRQQRGIARTLQQALLPAVPALGCVQVAARYLAGAEDLEVGGDWYDVIERRPGCVVFVVGDVSGRGLPAATTMAALRFAIRGFLYEGHDIDTVLSLVRGLLDVTADHQFATVLLGELDATAGRLRLVSAGHFGPLLLSDAGIQLIDCPVAPPVGVELTGPAPAAATVDVAGPATLLAFTDGLVERRGEVIDAGLDRLRAAAGTAAARPLDEMLDQLLGALIGDGRRDDTVLLGLRWKRP